MEFGVLGPLETREGDRSLPLGGPRQRALLARLLLEANRTVPIDRLVDDLWGDEAPESAVKMIQIYVSQLRKLLPRDVLQTRPPGYLVAVEEEALDVARFTRLRGEGRAALAAGDAAQASRRLREALALWRGPALAEFSEPFAAAEGTRLEELRMICLENRIEADLALGRHAELVPEVEALVARSPLRERLRGQLMLALYRSGRHAEALAAYQDLRRTLADELGLEPSAALKELERQILRQEPALDRPAAGEPIDAAPASLGRRATSPVPRPGADAPIGYVRSGDVSIAYQVVGEGPLDIVLVHGWVCSFHPGWEHPAIASFYRRLASLGRLILFDKRGTGLSDRVRGVAPLEQRIDDVRAVMDAVGSERAAVIGVSEGGPMVALFAATHPQRTAALVAIGTYARRMWAPDYPIGRRPDGEGWLVPDPREWGVPVAQRFLEERAPSIAGDEDAVRWYASYIVRGASPEAAAELARMNEQIDVRHVLPTIGVPTLVIYRSREFFRDATRYMGQRIPEARVVELPGADHLPWEGDQDAVMREIERFLAGTFDEEPEPDRFLTTVLCSKVAATGVLRERYAGLVRAQLNRFRGRELDSGADDVRVSFDGPARAIRCACAITEAAAAREIDVRVGVHTGECEIVEGRLEGPAVAIGAGVAGLASPGEILVSSTVRDLVAGSGIGFRERDVAALPLADAPRDWRLFSVDR